MDCSFNACRLPDIAVDRSGSGNAQMSACDMLKRGYGVCRDFAHVVIALCRALDLPPRYVARHIPRLAGDSYGDESDIGRDFHAYVEVYLGGRWHTYDARHNQLLIGRIKIAHGMDAADAAFATFYGEVEATVFNAWSHQAEITPAAASDHRSIDAALQRVPRTGHIVKRSVRSKIKPLTYQANDNQDAIMCTPQ